MKRILFVLLTLFFNLNILLSQLTVTPYPNPASGTNGAGGNLLTFVQNNLIGSGITVSNVTFHGANRQLGSFNAINTKLYTDQGMDKGIILSTGMAEDAKGPNDVPWVCNTPFTAPYPGNSGGYIGDLSDDPDLHAISGSSLQDKAILEFDFIPEG